MLDWTLLPADIARAAAVAPAGAEAVVDACRATIARSTSAALATRLPRPLPWDDLVLPAPVRRHLQELEAQARLRWPVYEDWGFGRLCPMGRGIAALFAGPSGTGKTMAAQVLARSLGMELYRIDLAAVVSKYIGETEKNLRRVFDACERANVLLFFDEADALFGQRTRGQGRPRPVRQHRDRLPAAAHGAVRRHRHPGDQPQAATSTAPSCAGSASSSTSSRRASPSAARCGRRRCPSRAPDGEELLEPIDWDALAQRLEHDRRGHQGRGPGCRLPRPRPRAPGSSMTHVMHAARRELAKHGVVVRSETWEDDAMKLHIDRLTLGSARAVRAGGPAPGRARRPSASPRRTCRRPAAAHRLQPEPRPPTR